MKRATIRDVAEKAGVGTVTVSYVLNGRSKKNRISEQTANRVLEAAEALNYRPHAVAKMLVTRRTDVIGVVFQRGSFFTSWSGFTSEVMRGVASEAVELGYDVMLHTKDVLDTQEADQIANGQLDGALVLRDEGDDLVEQLGRRGLPTVRFFCQHAGGEPFVDADNFRGGKMATDHLIALGHRRIAMVHGAAGSTSSNERRRGYLAALESAGLEAPENYRIPSESAGNGDKAFRSLMASPLRPTALFVWSDEVAFGVLAHLREFGLRVPEDVSVIGFDSLESCNRSVPPLTSVRQPIVEMAREAVRLLAAIIRGEEAARRQVLFPLVVDLRGSTAPRPRLQHEGVSS